MENASLTVGKKLIRAVIDDAHKAEHLCDSWAGRNGDFGSFFLNLSHETQGFFIEYWGVPIPALAEYSRQKEENPISVLFGGEPGEVTWIHKLMQYFNNHGIGDYKHILLPSLPVERYGNSKNWGNYILGLSPEGRDLVISQQYAHLMNG
ncbi:hypothetical protein IQ277_28030 [Nostocales cyanobacterium LEGE 12452]|nr:hypothetical protein [Nostocales cyanobacterium LEGE 12452]